MRDVGLVLLVVTTPWTRFCLALQIRILQRQQSHVDVCEKFERMVRHNLSSGEIKRNPLMGHFRACISSLHLWVLKSGQWSPHLIGLSDESWRRLLHMTRGNKKRGAHMRGEKKEPKNGKKYISTFIYVLIMGPIWWANNNVHSIFLFSLLFMFQPSLTALRVHQHDF